MQHAGPTISGEGTVGPRRSPWSSSATPWHGRPGATQVRQRRVDEEAAREAQEGGELARQALDLQIESVALMAENAVANPRFLAALRGRGRSHDVRRSARDRKLVGALPHPRSRLSRTTARRSRSRRRRVREGVPVGRSEAGRGERESCRAAMAGRARIPGRGAAGAARADARRCWLLARRIDDALLIEVAGRYGGARHPAQRREARAGNAGAARSGAARAAGGA